MSTITLTYGDVCENHVGMQQIGKLCDEGLTPELLERLHRQYPNDSQLIELSRFAPDLPRANLLIIRNGVNLLLDNNYQALLEEQSQLKPDTQAFMKGRVVNKHARYNLCFSDESQPADFAEGKGTVVAFRDVPYTSQLKEIFQKLFEIEELKCEGNYYYDLTKDNVGIGFHGDTERRVVIGVRLGEAMPIEFQWYHQFKPTFEPVRITLNGGDIYAMSIKATGFDWKKSSILTLRHAAGSERFLDNERIRVKKLVEQRTPKKTIDSDKTKSIDYHQIILDCEQPVVDYSKIMIE